MTKGIFIRVSEEVYENLLRQARKEGVSLYGFLKQIIEGYGKGKLKIVRTDEEETLETKLELDALKKKIDFIESDFSRLKEIIERYKENYSTLNEFIDQLVVLEQKLRSVEIRLQNIEKELRRGKR